MVSQLLNCHNLVNKQSQHRWMFLLLQQLKIKTFPPFFFHMLNFLPNSYILPFFYFALFRCFVHIQTWKTTLSSRKQKKRNIQTLNMTKDLLFSAIHHHSFPIQHKHEVGKFSFWINERGWKKNKKDILKMCFCKTMENHTMMKYFCHKHKKDFHPSRQILSKTMTFLITCHIKAIFECAHRAFFSRFRVACLSLWKQKTSYSQWVDKLKRKIIIMFPDMNLSN